MKYRADLKKPVLHAIIDNGGSAHLRIVAKFIWDHYRQDLEDSPLIYTWQYDYRWAADELRKEGVLRPTNKGKRGVWELAIEHMPK